MNFITTLFLGTFISVVAGLGLPFLFRVVAIPPFFMLYPVNRFIAGCVLIALALALGLTITAWTYLLAARAISIGYGPAWLVWFFAIWTAALPLGRTVDFARKEATRAPDVREKQTAWTLLGAVSWLQVIGMAILFFSDTALDWFRWLPS